MTDDDYGLQQELLEHEPPDVDYELEPPDEGLSRADGCWHMQQRGRYVERAEQIAAVFDEEIDKLQSQKTKALAPLEAKAAWHASAVESWHRQAFAARPSQAEKTEHLPGGTSRLTAPPVSYKVTDDESLRAYLEDQYDEETGNRLDELVWRREEKFLVSELKKRFKPPKRGKRPEPGTMVPVIGPDGEDVPGVVALYTADKWSVS